MFSENLGKREEYKGLLVKECLDFGEFTQDMVLLLSLEPF
jgi:hypothetical protein